MKVHQIISLFAVLMLAACRSTIPTAADMDRYHQEAERRAQEQIARLDDKRDRGEISQSERDRKVEDIQASITARASDLAWSRHALVEAEKVSMGIPTGDNPAGVSAPSKGSTGGFYRPAGSSGSGYQGASAFSPQGYQPGSTVNALRPNRGF